MMAISVAIGVLATTGGLLLSYWLNTGSGATIVLLATAVFFAALAASPRRRSGRARTSRPAPRGEGEQPVETAGSAD